MDWNGLGRRISERRECGEVICGGQSWSHPPSVKEIAEWLASEGIQAYGQPGSRELDSAEALPMIRVDKQDARDILTWLVKFDLAYEGATGAVGDIPEVDLYLHSVLPEAEYKTNGDLVTNLMTWSREPEKRKKFGAMGAWMPMTSATFDAGILTLHPHQTTFLWFSDED